MIESFRYAYLLGNLFFVLIWFILFLYRRDLRKEMLVMSFIIMPMGPLTEFFYLRDYWRPELFNGWAVGIEDLLFAFTIGGIAAVIYEEFFSKKYLKKHLALHPKWMFVIFPLGYAWMFLGNIVLGFNSIYISISGLLIFGIPMLFFRHDLLKNAVFSGLFMGLFMLVFYIFFIAIFNGVIQRWWLLGNISGILILGVPIEELMWGFSCGFFVGPTYEFINGLKFKKP